MPCPKFLSFFKQGMGPWTLCFFPTATDQQDYPSWHYYKLWVGSKVPFRFWKASSVHGMTTLHRALEHCFTKSESKNVNPKRLFLLVQEVLHNLFYTQKLLQKYCELLHKCYKKECYKVFSFYFSVLWSQPYLSIKVFCLLSISGPTILDSGS